MRALAAAGLTLALSIGALTIDPDAGFTQEQRTGITVSNNSDVLSGDTTSVENLQANSGPDGISLREAIEATNNDPGSYAIGFDPALEGAVIVALSTMPGLASGGVSIDGDVDGDGTPDITIRNNEAGRMHVVNVASGGNRVGNLVLKNAIVGVAFSAAPLGEPLITGQTFSSNVLSGLVISNVDHAGVAFSGGQWYSGCNEPACESNNTWADTKIVGNTITTQAQGIEAVVGNLIGDHLRGIRIVDNTIRFIGGRGCSLAGFGINLDAGNGFHGTANNRITDAVVRGNVITGEGTVALRVMAGSEDGDNNRIVGVQIRGNRVDIGPVRKNGCSQLVAGVFIATGDGAKPPKYPQGNLVRNVVIKNNRLADGGIRLMGGCCGARHNDIRDVEITNNTVRAKGLMPGISANANWEGGKRATVDNRVVGVTIDSNNVSLTRVGTRYLPSPHGGISIGGANYTGRTDIRTGMVKDVRITNNRIDTKLIGISIYGGWAGKPGEALDNAVVGLLIAGNRVLRAPRLEARFASTTRGINFLGGGFDSHRNRVTCVRIRDNLVAGVRDAVSLLANYSVPGLAGNTVRLSCR